MSQKLEKRTKYIACSNSFVLWSKMGCFRYYGYFMKNRNKGMDYITHT